MRARNIKPGFFKNEKLADCHPLARILFAGLWCMADREGRMECRPRKIKCEILPYDETEVAVLLRQLQDAGFIKIYTSGDREFIEVVNFLRHQNPHHREAASAIPAPNKNDQPQASPGLAQDKPQDGPGLARLIPDSGFLIPESIPPTPPCPIDPSPSQPIQGSPLKTYTYPDWLNRKLWANYCRMRTRIKKPITTTETIERLLNKLRGNNSPKVYD